MKIHLKHPGILGKVIKASFYIVYHLFSKERFIYQLFVLSPVAYFFLHKSPNMQRNFNLLKLKIEFSDFIISTCFFHRLIFYLNLTKPFYWASIFCYIIQTIKWSFRRCGFFFLQIKIKKKNLPKPFSEPQAFVT